MILKKISLTVALVVLVVITLSANVFAGNSLSIVPPADDRVIRRGIVISFNESVGSLTISGTGEMGDYSDVNPPWESYKDRIKLVKISDGITSVGNNAFSNCKNLAIATIPSSVVRIGNDAFYKCTELTTVIIPENVASIGNNAFAYCQCLTSVIIPKSITDIGEYAFYGCTDLGLVAIEGNLKTIGRSAFAYCKELVSFLYFGNFDPENDCTIFDNCVRLWKVIVTSDYEDDLFCGICAEYVRSSG